LPYLDIIENAIEEPSIMVVWYEDVEWASPASSNLNVRQQRQ